VLGVVAAVVVGCTVARQGSSGAPAPSTPSASSAPSLPSAPSGPSKGTSSAKAKQDHAQHAASVREHAAAAGVNPVLVMAILYNENYKPHDPELERAWARIDDNPAFGIANMHEAAFNDTKKGKPFASRRWDELPDDPDLAVQSAAWHLHDLNARLPARWAGPHTRDELLALGYNTGRGNMAAFARGTRLGPQAQSYLDKLHDNWSAAEQALKTG
jgi:hypothetical protein